MNIEELRLYFLSKKAATESLPFDDKTLVFKVQNKMFGLMGLENNPPSINLKCDPEKAIALREEHDCVKPGYHMNKQHWNTITVDGSVDFNQIKSWIDDSYNLIVKSLTKKLRDQLNDL